ncbi:nucleotidyltransferase family protein [Methanoculleus bourgensis]|uniref:nucleotidyltransferase family protein n=1 Tax=Methanoculleus bourgensis TaxID=83986 RepID=UPI002FDA7D5C
MDRDLRLVCTGFCRFGEQCSFIRERSGSTGRNDVPSERSSSTGVRAATSDIDIPVRFARTKSLFSLVRIENELARALGMKVDLVTKNAVSPYLADAIYRDAVVIYDAGGPRVSSSHP